jgi:hypothetical protein
MEIAEVLSEFDRIDRTGFSESAVSGLLSKHMPEDPEKVEQVWVHELLAFHFSENNQEKEGGWGTYYGPTAAYVQEDGSVVEVPSIDRVTEEALTYWMKRAKEAKNPMLVARYAGLVWDFQKIVTQKRPPIEACHLYIESVLKIADGAYDRHRRITFIRLERAISLSLTIGSKELVDKCKAAVLKLGDSVSKEFQPNLWGQPFDLLVENKKVLLSEEEKNKVVGELEGKLETLITGEYENKKVDPWSVEAIALRLARFYRKARKDEEVKRVVLSIGEAFNKEISTAGALQASGWLEHLYRLYSGFKLKEEAEEILIRLREIGPKAAEDMVPVSHSFKLPEEEVELFLGEILAGESEDVFLKVCNHFIPDKEENKKKLLELSKQHPLLFFVGNQIQDRQGRVVASVGSLEDDLEGHIVLQISRSMEFAAVLLRLVLNKGHEKLLFTTESLVEFIKKSPAIQEERLSILHKGITSFFEDDFLSCLHLLIPQIEQAVRNVLEFGGGNVLKPSGGGSFHLRTFDDILRDPILIEVFGDDFCLYLRVLFTDQRGWNLRNDVCHGILHPDFFNADLANRVIHALLCLGLLRLKNVE